MKAALAGLCVVDVSGSVATSYCAKLFADHGADVVNLEPVEGFATRRLPPFLEGPSELQRSAMHAYLSTNKRSVCVDGIPPAVIASIVSGADLLLDDGADPWPGIEWRGVRCSISWYGLTGPYAKFTGTDAQCYALNGMLRIIGRPEGPPVMPTGHQAQFVGGVTGYVASLGHLLARELGTRTDPLHVDTSIYESTMCFTDVGVITAYNTGLQAHRTGINRFPPTYPLGVFPCRDGWIGLTVLTPKQWHAFCALLGMEDLADVPLFQSAIARYEAADVLEPILSEKLLGFSAEDLFYRGQEMAIPLARVPTMEELFDIDQYVARRAFSEAEVTASRSVTVPSVPFRLFATPPAFGGPVADLGQNNGDFST